jgi:hypothetical protein
MNIKGHESFLEQMAQTPQILTTSSQARQTTNTTLKD